MWEEFGVFTDNSLEEVSVCTLCPSTPELDVTLQLSTSPLRPAAGGTGPALEERGLRPIQPGPTLHTPPCPLRGLDMDGRVWRGVRSRLETPISHRQAPCARPAGRQGARSERGWWAGVSVWEFAGLQAVA